MHKVANSKRDAFYCHLNVIFTIPQSFSIYISGLLDFLGLYCPFKKVCNLTVIFMGYFLLAAGWHRKHKSKFLQGCLATIKFKKKVCLWCQMHDYTENYKDQYFSINPCRVKSRFSGIPA